MNREAKVKRSCVRLVAWLAIASGAIGAAGCASSTAWPAKGPVAPKRSGVDRRVLGPEELAALLQDNPVSIARRTKQAQDEAIAKASPSGADGSSEPDAPPEPDLAPLMQKAVEALEEKDWDAAAQYAREVIEKDSKNGYPYAHVVLGDVALHAKDYEAALEHYRKAIELDPNDGWAVQRAAQALVALGRRPAALALLRKFVADHPDADADTWDALAWLELEGGNLAAAKDAFEHALRASDGKDAEAWYGLALIAARLRDPVGTEKALAALFGLQPERRVVIERDPTFFRMRIHPNVKSLFSKEKMAAAQLAAEKKKAGEPVDAPAVAAATKLSIPGGASTVTETIRFDYDSAAIKSESAATLDEIASFLRSQSSGLEWVEITGHADRRGDEAYNIRLSELRAKRVRDALVKRGVPSKLLRARGYGVYCPLDDGDDEGAFAKNRRVQFAIAAGGKLLGDELTCNERMRKWLKPLPASKIVKITKK